MAKKNDKKAGGQRTLHDAWSTLQPVPQQRSSGKKCKAIDESDPNENDEEEADEEEVDEFDERSAEEIEEEERVQLLQSLRGQDTLTVDQAMILEPLSRPRKRTLTLSSFLKASRKLRARLQSRILTARSSF